MNSLVPDGSTFSKANVVMYGSATYKQRYEWENPQSKTLKDFIKDDSQNYMEEHKGVSITEAPSLTTEDGQKLKSYTFFGPKDKLWERVAYGEEGDFYLAFTVSARSEASYRNALPAYEALVGRYRK
jgi:hypothetical protein